MAAIDIQFNAGPGGTSYVSTLHLSNRKARFGADVFVRPAVTGQQLGFGGLSAGAFGGLIAGIRNTFSSGDAGVAVAAFGAETHAGVAGFGAEAGGAVGGFGQTGGEAVGGFGQAGAAAIQGGLGDINPGIAESTQQGAMERQASTQELRQGEMEQARRQAQSVKDAQEKGVGVQEGGQ